MLVEHVWDVTPILDEDATLGSILKSLLGYNGNPSLLEVVSYIGYFTAIALVSWRQSRLLASLAPPA